MADINENAMDEVIVLTNEDGEESEFELMDIVDYEGSEYVVLLPVEDEGEGEVVIFKTTDLDEETCTYEAVDSEETLMTVFEIFKEKYKDDIDFVDC